MKRAMAASVGCILVTAQLLAQTGAAKQEELTAVLGRTAKYLDEYQAKLSNVVAEETYTQDVRGMSGPRPGSGRTSHRKLKSDLLLVKAKDDGPWLQFRDVFEVDAKPVRDRDERLLKLFIEPKVDRQGQAELIAREGARYNIGPIDRTINVPVLALLYFTNTFRDRSKFNRVTPGNVKRFETLARADGIWAVEFKETGDPTLIRGAKNANLAAKGRAWIEAATGRVLGTQLIAEDNLLRATVDVNYGAQSGLELLVPILMKENYVYLMASTRIYGEASYGRFRQFKVTTEEKPKPQ